MRVYVHICDVCTATTGVTPYMCGGRRIRRRVKKKRKRVEVHCKVELMAEKRRKRSGQEEQRRGRAGR